MHTLIEGFVGQLGELWRRAIADALGGVHGSGNGKSTVRPGGLAKGEKRTPESLEKLAEQFVAFVGKHPGLRIEQINKQLGTTTKDLALPIRKLVADRRLKVKGQKRSTTYFAT